MARKKAGPVQWSQLHSQPQKPVQGQNPRQGPQWAPEAGPGSQGVVKTRSCWKKKRERQQGLKNMAVGKAS